MKSIWKLWAMLNIPDHQLNSNKKEKKHKVLIILVSKELVITRPLIIR